jgi:hypothetical protein
VAEGEKRVAVFGDRVVDGDDLEHEGSGLLDACGERAQQAVPTVLGAEDAAPTEWSAP